jgi:hypothetical protein
MGNANLLIGIFRILIPPGGGVFQFTNSDLRLTIVWPETSLFSGPEGTGRMWSRRLQLVRLRAH